MTDEEGNITVGGLEQQFQAGGFVSNTDRQVDETYPYFTVADSGDLSAKKLKEEQVLDDANQVESVREQDIVQMNLTDKEAAALGKKYKDLRIEPNLMVNACTDGENVGTEGKVQWYRDALNIPDGTVG